MIRQPILWQYFPNVFCLRNKTEKIYFWLPVSFICSLVYDWFFWLLVCGYNFFYRFFASGFWLLCLFFVSGCWVVASYYCSDDYDRFPSTSISTTGWRTDRASSTIHWTGLNWLGTYWNQWLVMCMSLTWYVARHWYWLTVSDNHLAGHSYRHVAQAWCPFMSLW